MGSIQRRKGPNVTGIFGLPQPHSDGLKLFVKEIVKKFLFAVFFLSLTIFSLFLPSLGFDTI